MKRLLLALAFILAGGAAQAGVDTLDALSSGAPIGKTDLIPLCTNASCATLKKITPPNLTTYLNDVEARCANAAGDGAIIQTAVDTGKPVHIIGPCVGDTTVTVSTEGQKIHGPATITVSAVVAGTGTFACTTGGNWHTGPIWEDLTIIHTQVDTATRASLTNFKDTFHLADCFAAKIRRIRMEECMACIAMTGESGQVTIEDVEMSPISVGISITATSGNGAADTVRVHNVHIWPFGAQLVQSAHSCGTVSGGTAGTLCFLWNTINTGGVPQTTVGTAGPIGIYINGTMDDLNITNTLFLVGQGMFINNTGTFGTTLTPLINIANSAFDTFPGLNMIRGNVRISGSYFSTPLYALAPSGGNLQVSGSWFLATGSTAPIIEHTGGNLAISGGLIDMNGNSQNAIHSTSGALNVSGVQFGASTGTTINAASGSTASIMGAQLIGSAGTSFITVGADAAHRIVGNSAGSNSCPATQTNMRSANNGTAANATCN